MIEQLIRQDSMACNTGHNSTLEDETGDFVGQPNGISHTNTAHYITHQLVKQAYCETLGGIEKCMGY